MTLYRYQLPDTVPASQGVAIKSSSDGVMVLDRDNHIQYLNQAARRIIGVSAAQAIGRPASQILADYADLLEQYRHVIEADSEITLWVDPPDKSLGREKVQQHYGLHISPLTDQRGQLTGRVVVLHDITRHKKVEQVLRARKQLFESLAAVAIACSKQPTLVTALQNTLELAAKLSGAEAGGLVLFNDEITWFGHGSLLYNQTSLEQQTALKRLVAEKGLVNRVSQQFKPVLIADADHDERWQPDSDETLPVRSALGVPLVSGALMVGVLTLMHSEPNRFNTEHLQLMQVTAHHIALAMRNAQIFDAQRRISRRQRILYEVLRAVAGQTDPEAVAQVVVETVTKFGDWPLAGVLLPDETQNQWQARVVGGRLASAVRHTFPLEQGIVGRAFRTAQAQRVSDVRTDPDYVIGHPSIRSELAVPIQQAGRILGVLDLESDQLAAFVPDDVLLAESLAESLALALDNAWLYQAERAQRQELEAVQRVSVSLTSSLQLPQVLNIILQAISELTAPRSIDIFLYAENRLSFGAAMQVEGPCDRPMGQPRPDGLTYSVARQGKAAVVPDARSHSLYARVASKWGLGAIVSLPLKIGQRVVGVMNVTWSEAGPLSASELRLLRLLADQAAIAIENARLFEDVVKYKFIVNTSQELMALIDRNYTYEAANQAYSRAHNLSPLDIIGRTVADVQGQAEFETNLKPRLDRCLAGEQVHYQAWFEPAGQEAGCYDVTYYPYRTDDQISHAVVVAHDITAYKQTEAALRQSEERYALAARGANDGLWDWDLQTNQIYFSPRWKAMLGYNESEIGYDPDDWFKRVHQEDRSRVRTEISAHLNELTTHFESEHRMLHKDGSYRWMLNRGLAVRDRAGQAYRIVGSQTDITERKRAEQQLLHDAFHNAVTGLPNRALFLDHLERSLGHARRQGDYLFAVLFLDLDRFMIVKQSLGHEAGDRLLTEVASRLKRCVRPGDTVAHLGGDKFSILLEDLKDAGEATQIADQVQYQLAQPINLNGHETFTSVSIGISLSGRRNNQAEEILRDAETAMYQAKALGRARYKMFNSSLHASLVARLELETDLRRAMDRQELELLYQPVVSLGSGQISGIEALLRWQHPQRGLVLPAEFISLAEEIGLIAKIGEWVLRTACSQARNWHEAGYRPLRLALNVSVCQFQDQNLPELVKTMLKETGLAASSLELEVTESMAMFKDDFSVTSLNELSKMGVHISIDDFGTDYSSLSRLKSLPVNTLKIDQSFIRDIASDPSDAAIVTAIIAMAHSLNLKVIAEGVEAEEQLAFLQEHRCDEVQGHLFSQPLSAEALTSFLQDRGTAEKL